jgi:hypothetical protein
MAFKMRGFPMHDIKSAFQQDEKSEDFMENNKLEMRREQMIREYVKTGIMPKTIDTSMIKSLGDTEEGRRLLEQYYKDREVTTSEESLIPTKDTTGAPIETE